MIRLRKTAILLAAMLVVGAGASLAQTQVGFFEGPPGNATAVHGASTLTGWVLADVGVRRVIIQVDGVDIGQAGYGQVRPGVTAQNPGFPDSAAPGFGYILNATDFSDGQHTISARAELMDGSFYEVPSPIVLQFANSTHNLRPFGAIDRPNRNANLVGVCDLSNPARRPVIFEGWALDLGVEIGEAGIGYVELMFDGVILANTRRDCRFDMANGGFTNCYGLRRLDIERQYPFALDAPNAGFRFAVDFGVLYNIGHAEGHHDITIRAGDLSNQVENIDEFAVTFVCAENIGNEPAFGKIESPRFNRFYTGLVRVEGWVLDAQGVQRVDVYVDGDYVRSIGISPVLTRPSVTMNYPGFPDSAHPVFRGFIDSNDFVDGIRQLEIIAVDVTGAESVVGEVDFLVNNDHD